MSISRSHQNNHYNSDSSDDDSNNNYNSKNIIQDNKSPLNSPKSPKISSNSIDINNFELVDNNNIDNINRKKYNNQSPSLNKIIKNVSIVTVETTDHAASIIQALRKTSISSRRYQRETEHVITNISEFDQIVTAKGLEVEEKQHMEKLMDQAIERKVNLLTNKKQQNIPIKSNQVNKKEIILNNYDSSDDENEKMQLQSKQGEIKSKLSALSSPFYPSNSNINTSIKNKSNINKKDDDDDDNFFGDDEDDDNGHLHGDTPPRLPQEEFSSMKIKNYDIDNDYDSCEYDNTFVDNNKTNITANINDDNWSTNDFDDDIELMKGFIAPKDSSKKDSKNKINLNSGFENSFNDLPNESVNRINKSKSSNNSASSNSKAFTSSTAPNNLSNGGGFQSSSRGGIQGIKELSNSRMVIKPGQRIFIRPGGKRRADKNQACVDNP